MATFASAQELKKMSLAELTRERDTLSREAAKMRLGIELQKEKNHGLYRRMKKQIARISTVVTFLQAGALKNQPVSATLSASEKPKTPSSEKPTKKTKKASTSKSRS